MTPTALLDKVKKQNNGAARCCFELVWEIDYSVNTGGAIHNLQSVILIVIRGAEETQKHKPQARRAASAPWRPPDADAPQTVATPPATVN